MDKQDLERLLEAAEKQNIGLMDEIKNLKAKLAEMQDEPEIPDFPIFKQAGDEAWHINNVLDVSTPGITSGHVCDFNYFHTEAYAKEFAKKCKLIAMMLHFKWYIDRDYVPDWSDKLKHKWQLYYDHDEKKMAVGNYSRSDYSVVFSTEEKAQRCAEWLNEHWKEDGND